MTSHLVAVVVCIINVCWGPGSVVVEADPFYTADPAQVEPQPLLITGATLIDGTGANPSEDVWIHVDGDLIVAVGRGRSPSIPGAQVINLGGKTVIPGLSDMHVHLGDLVSAKWMLKLLLAHGVTTIRDVGNSFGNLSALRRWMPENEPVPRLHISGQMMNGSWGDRAFLTHGFSLQSELENNLAFGVDFLKIHNWVSTLALEQIIDFAEEHDLYLAGHVPLCMTTVAAIDAGMKILEHVRLRPWEVLDDPEIIARYPVDLVLMKRTGYWAYFDPNASAPQRTLEAWEKRRDRFFVDPTFIVRWAGAYEYEGEELLSEKLEMVSTAMLKNWRRSVGSYGGKDLSPEEREGIKASLESMMAFIGMAHERGIRMLTGTDTPVQWVIPGYSIHQELEFLVGAGMSPVEAIHASTGRAAEVLRIADAGVIAAGKKADLVIVDGDVAADIRNIRNIEQVILGGRIYTPDQLFREAAEYAARDVPPADKNQPPIG